MNEIIQEVDNILNKYDLLSYEFGDFSKIYLMTTENIKDFLVKYDLYNKDVLTVAGSGDQMLNAFLMGARSVTCFDINPLAFYQVNLKKAAISTLPYEEYLEFYFPEFGKFLDRGLFEKIADSLDNNTFEFFNYLYSRFDEEQIFRKIYQYFKPKFKNMKKINAYLEKDNYQKLASILLEKDISFLKSNASMLDQQLEKKLYDIILLSNISDDIENIYDTNPLINFKNLVQALNKNLTDDGIIQVGYIYNYYFPFHFNLFNKKKQRNLIFTKEEFSTIVIDSWNDKFRKDGVIVYQKKK